MRSLEQHQRIIEAMRTRDPIFAERLVSQSVNSFLKETQNMTGTGQ
jgi:DNA-binding FadR family transcriptional regulator